MLTTLNINGNKAFDLNRDTEVPKLPARDEVTIRRKEPQTESRRDEFLSRAMNIYARSRGVRFKPSSII